MVQGEVAEVEIHELSLDGGFQGARDEADREIYKVFKCTENVSSRVFRCSFDLFTASPISMLLLCSAISFWRISRYRVFDDIPMTDHESQKVGERIDISSWLSTDFTRCDLSQQIWAEN
jgi:hypothetical protein